MTAYLAYTSYRCRTTDGKELNIALSGDVSVAQEFLQALVTDLRDLGVVKTPQPWTSVLGFEVGESKYSLERDHANASLKFTPATTDIYAELSSKLNSSVDVNSFQANLVIPSTQPKFSAELVDLLNDSNSSGPEDAEIETIEGRLAVQRKADEAQLKISDLENQLPDIEAKMKDVDGIVQKQGQLKQLLDKYSYILKPDISAESQKYKQEIEMIRNEYLQSLLKAEKDSEMSEEGEASKGFFPKDGLQGRVLFIYMGVTALFALLTSLVTRQFSWVALGVFFVLLQVLFLVLINKVPAAIAWTMKRQMQKPELEAPLSERAPELKKEQRLSWLEKFFIDKAWVLALQAEAENLTETMQRKLQGEDINALNTAKQKLNQEIESVRKDIDAAKGKEIPPEEYLDLRRKLEQLKSKKLENGEAAVGPSLISQLFSGQFIQASIEGDSLQLESSGGNFSTWNDLPADVKFTITLLAALSAWQQAPILPLVLADILSRVAAQSKVVINRLIEEARSKGQILTINLAQ